MVKILIPPCLNGKLVLNDSWRERVWFQGKPVIACHSLQRMFTIFEEENEPLTERAKVDELLTKVQHTALTAAVAQLRYYQLNTVGVTFTVAANHLNSEISQTSDYQMSRKISSVNTPGRGGGRAGRGSGRGGRGRGRGGKGGRSNSDSSGSGTTGYFSPAEWEKLSFEERDKIRKERDKKGEQGGSKRSISELTTKQLTTALISSLQKSTNAAEDSNSTPTTSNTAGNAFGGRESAKRAKTD